MNEDELELKCKEEDEELCDNCREEQLVDSELWLVVCLLLGELHDGELNDSSGYEVLLDWRLWLVDLELDPNSDEVGDELGENVGEEQLLHFELKLEVRELQEKLVQENDVEREL